jgi:hypothetical protein
MCKGRKENEGRKKEKRRKKRTKKKKKKGKEWTRREKLKNERN